MEVPETAPRRKRTSLLWVIPLLVVVALGVDSALMMVRDTQVRAAAREQLSTAPAGGGGCGGGCASGGCGMMAAAKDAKGAKPTCPADEAIARKGAGETKPEAAKAHAAGCPTHQAKADGKCPADADCGKKPGETCAHGGDGSCPKQAAAAKAAAGSCPVGADCGKKPGESCPHAGKGGCPVKQTAKPGAKPTSAAKAKPTP